MLMMSPSTRSGDMSRKGFRGFKFSVLGFKAWWGALHIHTYILTDIHQVWLTERGCNLHVVEVLRMNVKAQVSLDVPTQRLYHIHTFISFIYIRAHIHTYIHIFIHTFIQNVITVE